MQLHDDMNHDYPNFNSFHQLVCTNRLPSIFGRKNDLLEEPLAIGKYAY